MSGKGREGKKILVWWNFSGDVARIVWLKKIMLRKMIESSLPHVAVRGGFCQHGGLHRR